MVNDEHVGKNYMIFAVDITHGRKKLCGTYDVSLPTSAQQVYIDFENGAAGVRDVKTGEFFVGRLIGC